MKEFKQSVKHEGEEDEDVEGEGLQRLPLINVSLEDDSLLPSVNNGNDELLSGNMKEAEEKWNIIRERSVIGQQEHANMETQVELGRLIPMVTRKKRSNVNLRKSLAWNKAFLTDEGVLDFDELHIVNKTFKTIPPHPDLPKPALTKKPLGIKKKPPLGHSNLMPNRGEEGSAVILSQRVKGNPSNSRLHMLRNPSLLVSPCSPTSSSSSIVSTIGRSGSKALSQRSSHKEKGSDGHRKVGGPLIEDDDTTTLGSDTSEAIARCNSFAFERSSTKLPFIDSSSALSNCEFSSTESLFSGSPVGGGVSLITPPSSRDASLITPQTFSHSETHQQGMEDNTFLLSSLKSPSLESSFPQQNDISRPLKPSALRMPSPRLGFFDPARATIGLSERSPALSSGDSGSLSGIHTTVPPEEEEENEEKEAKEEKEEKEEARMLATRNTTKLKPQLGELSRRRISGGNSGPPSTVFERKKPSKRGSLQVLNGGRRKSLNDNGIREPAESMPSSVDESTNKTVYGQQQLRSKTPNSSRKAVVTPISSRKEVVSFAPVSVNHFVSPNGAAKANQLDRPGLLPHLKSAREGSLCSTPKTPPGNKTHDSSTLSNKKLNGRNKSAVKHTSPHPTAYGVSAVANNRTRLAPRPPKHEKASPVSQYSISDTKQNDYYQERITSPFDKVAIKPTRIGYESTSNGQRWSDWPAFEVPSSHQTTGLREASNWPAFEAPSSHYMRLQEASKLDTLAHLLHQAEESERTPFSHNDANAGDKKEPNVSTKKDKGSILAFARKAMSRLNLSPLSGGNSSGRENKNSKQQQGASPLSNVLTRSKSARSWRGLVKGDI